MRYRRKEIVGLMIVLGVLILLFGAYQIYRRPATLRHLTDRSLSDEQTEELRAQLREKTDKKILVAYFSYSGTTGRVAEALSERIGADLFEIAPEVEYSNVYLQSNFEIMRNAHPSLKNTVTDMESYDIVFVGYPVWWHATPAPISTFLESYDLTGKLIIPFCTSGGSDIAETMPTFLNSCDGLAVYGERRMSGTAGIDEWLTELDLNLDAESESEAQEIGTSISEISAAEVTEETDAAVMEDADTEILPSGNTESTESNMLVVYFSWSGNTEEMASYIAGQIGADCFHKFVRGRRLFSA